jgi:hypothetical protein
MALRKLSVLFLAVASCSLVTAPAARADFPDAEAILGDLGKAAGGAAVEAVIGSVLSQYGLGNATAGQLQEVLARLDRIESKLNDLEQGQANLASQILGTELRVSLSQTNALTGDLDERWADLQEIFEITDADQRKRRTTSWLEAFRNSPSYSALETLDKYMVGAAGQTGLIVASSSVVRSQHRFFRHAQSVEARKVYHYFKYYEVMALAMALEYRKAYPNDYSTTSNETFFANKRAVIRGQRNYLKPLVPAGLAVDTTTGLGWEFSTLNSHVRWVTKFPNNKVAQIDPEMGFASWLYTRVPGTNDLASLLAGHTGDPIAWLQREAGFPAVMTPGDIGYAVWSNSGYWQEECQDIFQYFNCRDVAYTTAVVIRRECHSDPDHTVCDPFPGQAKNVRVSDSYRAGTIQMLFQPQNWWYYPPPAKAAKKRIKAKQFKRA